MDDDEILARVRAGDDDALVELLEGYRAHLLWRITSLHGVGAQDAEDILQEVFRRCIAQRGRLRRGVRAYLQTITRNVCLDHHRRRIAEARAIQASLDASGHAPMDLIDSRLDARRILGGLKRRCREIITGVLLREKTHDEYARETDTPRGTVGTTVARCLEYARRIVMRHRGDEDDEHGNR